jgi:hypothetical protein
MAQNAFRDGMGDVPDRVFSANFAGLGLASSDKSNFHGIAYDAKEDRLVVSDVANPLAPADGRILIFENATTIGTPGGVSIPANTVIAGPNTSLGNPVDIALNGNALFVAEKANNRLLVWDNVFTVANDAAPDRVVVEDQPEALSLERNDGASAFHDVSDITIDDTVDAIFVVQNPASSVPAAVGEGDVKRVAIDTLAGTDRFNLLDNLVTGTPGNFNLQNGSMDATGDTYFSFDNDRNLQIVVNQDTDGGILVIGRMANARPTEDGTPAFAPTRTRDRLIVGNNTKLVRPKGVEVVNSLGLILVCESAGIFNFAAPTPFREPKILAFSIAAGGNVAPVMESRAVAGASPWDLDYDPINDRLFVALTNGQMLVYDTYRETGGVNGPDRVVTISSPASPNVRAFTTQNLHGIVYVQEADVVILSDVGNDARNDDGRIYVLENASTITGLVPYSGILAGPRTTLGNPVDLAYNGNSLFIAEKLNTSSQSAVLRFDVVIGATGGDVAPNMATGATNILSAESVFLSPAGLGGSPK